MVILLVILESLQITIFFAANYDYLITNYGNILFLYKVTWQIEAQLMFGFSAAFIVQAYFAFCVYMLKPESWFLPALIALFALAQIGTGVATIVARSRVGTFLETNNSRSVLLLIQSSAGLACDVAITFSLVRRLWGGKSDIQSTNSMLNQLIVYAVNRGALLVVCVALNIALYLVFPNTFYFFLTLLFASQLYMNIALATLNSRDHIRKVGEGSRFIDNNWNESGSISSLGSLRAAPGTQTISQHIVVRMSTETTADSDPVEKSSCGFTGPGGVV